MKHSHSEQVTIGGEQIRVREHRDDERFALQSSLAPIVEHFAASIEHDELRPCHMDAAYAKHAAQFARLLAVSCGKALSWVEKLSYCDFEMLLNAWWNANSDFVAKQILSRKAALPVERAHRVIN